jgi:hypothetical protein
MKHYGKLAAIGLVGVLTGGALAGCGSSENAVTGNMRTTIVDGLHNAGYPPVGDITDNRYDGAWDGAHPEAFSAELIIGKCSVDPFITPFNNEWVATTPSADLYSSGRPEPSVRQFLEDYCPKPQQH